MECQELFNIFKKNNLLFFTGVPDSTFKGWMSFLAEKNNSELTNIVACNECEAIAISSGHHLSTKKLGVVYMQNSGLGKAVNPLMSLCDPEVYSIPMIMLIGWRGMPGKKDEPQHKKMGKITLPLLKTLGIPFAIMPKEKKAAEITIKKMKASALKKNIPVAIIIKSGIISDYKIAKEETSSYDLGREEALKVIVDNLDKSALVVSTTGKISRELFEVRSKQSFDSGNFYTVGSMGCSASIALGISLSKPSKKVFIFDGDGAILMQMGALSTIGHYKPKNLFHIIFDNGSYESTGGQPSNSDTANFADIAINCGYKHSKLIKTKKELTDALKSIKNHSGPVLINIKVAKESRKDLGRPTDTPLENKKKFMKILQL